MRSQGRALREAARKLKKQQDVALYVEGRCDQRGGIRCNRGLGKRRAVAVVNYLARNGVPSDRLAAVSYGKERPFAEERGVVPYALNRRVEFKLMRGSVRLVLEHGSIVDDRGRPIPNPLTEAKIPETADAKQDTVSQPAAGIPAAESPSADSPAAATPASSSQ